MSLKAAFSVYGRASRPSYWTVTALCCIAAAVAGFLRGMIGDENPVVLVLAPFNIAIFIAALAVEIRRLHDIGWSGWWVLAPGAVAIAIALVVSALVGGLSTFAVALTYLVQIVWIITIGSIPGQRGPNRFGPPPGAPQPGEAAA